MRPSGPGAASSRVGSPAERAVGLFRQTGDRLSLAEAIMTLADALATREDNAQAAERWDEARTIYEQIGDPRAAEVARRDGARSG